MSKAIEDTLKKLEGAHISTPTPDTAASIPSSSATVSPSPQPPQSQSTNGTEPSGNTETSAPPSSSPTSAASTSVSPASDQARAVVDNDSLAKRRSRRSVHSMYGVPPGYNATMGVGSGSRDSIGRSRTLGRQRNSIMIPDHLQAAMLPPPMGSAGQLQTPAISLTGAEYALMANMPEDAIPNAIVVKNINFAIKREALLQTMADLGLPLPYAFNYHFDGGVFRGLAFGNFHTSEEAARVIVGLNGVTLLGRPLKVEYKKALPGVAPPPHPNTTAMMSAPKQASHPGSQIQRQESREGRATTGADSHLNDGSIGLGANQPIPRPRRNHNSEIHERPKSMMVFPSAMPVPEKHQQPQKQHGSNSSDNGSMIDLDDKDTRLLYDLVSQFRHDKGMAELEFPSTLNTKQRQSVMLIAERFGLNHETKGDANGRYIRVYKGLETLLEATEVRRRTVTGHNGHAGIGSAVGSAGNGQRYGSVGRTRPMSMMYPTDSMSLGGGSTMGGNNVAHHPHRMSMYQQQGYHDGTSGLARGRSYTHSQGIQGQQIAAAVQQQGFQSTQSFPRSGDNPGRASGNYVGYPSRLYQDSVVVPTRQPRGPDISQNFNARQQMQQQDERQMQRQLQLKVLQQNRQRRLSSAAEEGSSASIDTSTALATTYKIEKPVSKAIPIVKPQEDESDAHDNKENKDPEQSKTDAAGSDAVATPSVPSDNETQPTAQVSEAAK